MKKNWTTDRIQQLSYIDEVLGTLEMLNNGSGFLDRTKRLIILAKKLNETNINKPKKNFVGFLTELVIAEKEQPTN